MTRYYIPANGITLECTVDMFNDFDNYIIGSEGSASFILVRACLNTDKCFKFYKRDIRGMPLLKSSHNTLEKALEALEKYN